MVKILTNEEFGKRVSAEICGFTITKSDIDPFHWDFSSGKAIKSKGPSASTAYNIGSYSVLTDPRFAKFRTDANSGSVKCQYARMLALGITAGLMDRSFGIPTGEDLEELLDSIGLTFDDIFGTQHSFSKQYDDGVLSEYMLFQHSKQTAYAELFYIMLWCAITDLITTHPHCLNKMFKARKLKVGRGDHLKRFKAFLIKSTELGLFECESFDKDHLDLIENETFPINDDILQLYEEAVVKYSVPAYRQLISKGELHTVHARCDQYAEKLRKMRDNELKNYVKTGQSNALLAKPALRIGDLRPTRNFGMVSSNSVIVRPPAGADKMRSIDANFDALDIYYKNVVLEAMQSQNVAVMEESEFLNSLSDDDIERISEAALIAVANGSDLLKNGIATYFIAEFLCDTVGLPISNGQLPEDIYDDSNYNVICNKHVGINSVDLHAANESFFDEGNKLLQISGIDEILSDYAQFFFKGDVTINTSLVEALVSYGIEEQTAREMATFAEGLRYAEQCNDGIPGVYAPLAYAEGAWGRNDSSDQTEPVKPESTDVDILRQENARLKALVKANDADKQGLRHALANAERSAEAYKNQLAEMQKIIEEAKQDRALADEVDELLLQSATSSHRTFPYRTDKNIVVLAGRPKFCDALQKLMPDARFIPNASQYDLNVFRNADIVFLQINYMSHSTYHTVVDAVKAAGNGKIYHLNYAGARRCAEAMIEEIEKISHS